jgi:hypothetical protein
LVHLHSTWLEQHVASVHKQSGCQQAVFYREGFAQKSGLNRLDNRSTSEKTTPRSDPVEARRFVF